MSWEAVTSMVTGTFTKVDGGTIPPAGEMVMATLPVYTPGFWPCGLTNAVMAAREEAAIVPEATGTVSQQVAGAPLHCATAV